MAYRDILECISEMYWTSNDDRTNSYCVAFSVPMLFFLLPKRLLTNVKMSNWIATYQLPTCRDMRCDAIHGLLIRLLAKCQDVKMSKCQFGSQHVTYFCTFFHILHVFVSIIDCVMNLTKNESINILHFSTFLHIFPHFCTILHIFAHFSTKRNLNFEQNSHISCLQ